MEKYDKYINTYSNLYYENLLQIYYNRTGSRRQSRFLKILEKNEISLVTEKDLKKLKKIWYHISHSGSLIFIQNMLKRQTPAFQEWYFLIFHSESGNFFVFIKKNKGKSLNFIKMKWKSEISQALTAKENCE